MTRSLQEAIACDPHSTPSCRENQAQLSRASAAGKNVEKGRLSDDDGDCWEKLTGRRDYGVYHVRHSEAKKAGTSSWRSWRTFGSKRPTAPRQNAAQRRRHPRFPGFGIAKELELTALHEGKRPHRGANDTSSRACRVSTARGGYGSGLNVVLCSPFSIPLQEEEVFSCRR